MIARFVKNMLFSPFTLMIKAGLWLLALGVIAVLLFLVTFDINDYKADIEKHASAFLRQELKISGDIGLGIENFRPSIVLRNVSTKGAAADRVEVTLPFGMPDKAEPWGLFADFSNLLISGRRAGSFEAPLRFFDDGLEIRDIDGTLDDATLTGDVIYRAGRLSAELDLRGLDYSHIAEGMRGGGISGKITLQSAGQTEKEILSNLNGRVFLSGGAGELEGNAINLWAGNLLSLLLSGPQKETRLKCSIADFEIKNGKAHSRAVVFDTSRVTVYGKGTVDLVRGRVDMLFTPKPKDTALISLATPVRLAGTFGNIQALPDQRAVAGKLGGLLLTMVNPAVALLPMMERGTGEKNPCAKYLR